MVLQVSDPDGDQLAYSWIQTAGPHVTLNDPHTAASSFSVPTDITSDTDLTFKLTVTDDQNATSYDDVRITAKFIPPPPSDQTEQPPQGTVACDQVVEGNVTLTANLNCTRDGLIIGGDDATTINLNGFGIFGPGTDTLKAGIGVFQDSAAINGPGIISGFQWGVLSTSGNDLQLTEVNLEDNEVGISSSGVSNSKIHNNIMKNNGIAIVWNSSTYVNIESNTMQNNRLGGIFFSDTDQSSINNNDISGSQNGIHLDPLSSDNTVSLNTFSDNLIDLSLIPLNNANGLAPNINANNFLDNTCSVSNPRGLCVAP